MNTYTVLRVNADGKVTTSDVGVEAINHAEAAEDTINRLSSWWTNSPTAIVLKEGKSFGVHWEAFNVVAPEPVPPRYKVVPQ